MNPMIQVLYRVHDEIERELKHKQMHPVSSKVWFYESEEVEEYKQELSSLKEQLRITINNIISLEQDERDPEQDAEIRMEIEAAIAFSGNREDRAEWYMHTPMQEKLFQEQIYLELESDPDSQFYRPRMGYCPCCNGQLWEDDGYTLEGIYVCCDCGEDIACWMAFCWYFADRDNWKLHNFKDSWHFDEAYFEDISRYLVCGECGAKQVEIFGTKDDNWQIVDPKRMHCHDCYKTVRL